MSFLNSEEIIKLFRETFGKRSNILVYSAPGRVELGGNHTDHQRGNVLAAAVNLGMLAAVSENGENVLRVKSEGYSEFSVSLDDLAPQPQERNTAVALVRGVADALSERGVSLSGADIYITSDVPRGSGLSSSAAFEILLATALSDMFGSKLSATEKAKAGQYAETVHFGKPSGLMDQLTIAVGGIAAIDFASDAPKTEKIECDIDKYGYDLVIIDAGADHAGLTAQYAQIPKEMRSVAEYFGKSVLREVDRNSFVDSLLKLRRSVGDRAVLRALHFMNENERAAREAEHLKLGDFAAFLEDINASGRSSFMYLQNVYTAGAIKNQPMAYTLAVCEELLCGKGASRIQGGGFGGTVEAFIPKEMTKHFMCGMDKLIGTGRCRQIKIRNEGAIRVC